MDNYVIILNGQTMKKYLLAIFCLTASLYSYAQCNCSERNSYSTKLKLCQPVLFSEGVDIGESVLDAYAGVATSEAETYVVVILDIRSGTPYELSGSLMLELVTEYDLNNPELTEQKTFFEGNKTYTMGWYRLSNLHISALENSDYAEIGLYFENKDSLFGELLKDDDTTSSFFSHLGCLK